MTDWIVAILMTLIISVVYLLIDKHYTKKQREKWNRNEKLINEANSIDELIDLRSEVESKELIEMIDRKLYRLTHE